MTSIENGLPGWQRPVYTTAICCRSCGSEALERILDLGETPVANRLLSKSELDLDELRIPLRLMLCSVCGLLQIEQTVRPQDLFNENYPYFSSVSPELVAHSRVNAERLIRRCNLGPDSLVVEIASNDGYLLRHFAAHGVPVLGIEPAARQAAAAAARNIDTVGDFFSLDLARSLRAEGRQADVVIANNVLAHVPDINDFIAGIAELLRPDGMAVFEVPYAIKLIERCEFDTIYHEHVFYFTVTALQPIFERHGLSVTDVERLEIHGGSIRVFTGASAFRSAAVERMLADEEARKAASPKGYAGFADGVDHVRTELPALLGNLRNGGARVAAYGAAAKGATLLNTCGIGSDLIDFVVDRSPHKQGLYMPGVRLSIHPVEELAVSNPGYLLLLAWNFEREIRKQQAGYLARGNRLIVPVPTPRIAD